MNELEDILINGFTINTIKRRTITEITAQIRIDVHSQGQENIVGILRSMNCELITHETNASGSGNRGGQIRTRGRQSRYNVTRRTHDHDHNNSERPVAEEYH